MARRFGGIGSFVRVLALACGLFVVAACTEEPAALGESGELATQASGQFSSGSLDSGSILGDFTVVGLGNVTKTEYEVEMDVSGNVWFVCVNKGGNEAPGQFAFTLDDDAYVDPDSVDDNGRYSTRTLVVDPQPTNADCEESLNKNWRLKLYETGNPYGEVAGTPVMYLQPTLVEAFLYQLDETNPDDDSLRIALDRLEWQCDAPEPTYPLEEFVASYDEPLTGDGGVCTMTVGP